MLENGFRAVGSFPLSVRGEITGALTVYQSDLVPFGAEEVSLLDELAADLGYALEVLEMSRMPLVVSLLVSFACFLALELWLMAGRRPATAEAR